MSLKALILRQERVLGPVEAGEFQAGGGSRISEVVDLVNTVR